MCVCVLPVEAVMSVFIRWLHTVIHTIYLRLALDVCKTAVKQPTSVIHCTCIVMNMILDLAISYLCFAKPFDMSFKSGHIIIAVCKTQSFPAMDGRYKNTSI